MKSTQLCRRIGGLCRKISLPSQAALLLEMFLVEKGYRNVFAIYIRWRESLNTIVFDLANQIEHRFSTDEEQEELLESLEGYITTFVEGEKDG